MSKYYITSIVDPVTSQEVYFPEIAWVGWLPFIRQDLADDGFSSMEEAVGVCIRHSIEHTKIYHSGVLQSIMMDPSDHEQLPDS